MFIEKSFDKEKIIYYMLEAKYIKNMGGEINEDLIENNKYFPYYWYSNNNYSVKIKILTEAIQKKCLISKTDGYQEIVEGVRYNDKKDTEDKKNTKGSEEKQ